METLFQAVKDRLTMEEVVRDYGDRVVRRKALCPFHGDRHPSMQIYEKGYCCFACGAAGDLIDYVARRESISQGAACRLLSQRFHLGLTQGGYAAPSRKDLRKNEALAAWAKEAMAALLQYRRTLWFARFDSQSPWFEESLGQLERTDYHIACLAEDPAQFYQMNRGVVRRAVHRNKAAWG